MFHWRQITVWVRMAYLGVVLPWVTACSTTFSLGYEMGPFLVSRELEKRLPLSDEAEEKLDRDLEAYFEWHRRKMLGDYVSTLEDWRTKVGSGLSTKAWLWPDIGRLTADTLLPIAEIVCDPMSRYKAEDVAELRRLDKEARNKRKEREAGTPEQERERRWESFQSFLEDFIGDIEPSQIERWRETFEKAIEESRARRGQGRESWENFVSELEKGMSFPRCFEYMQGWITPAEKVRAERSKHWVLIYDQVLRDLTAEQRQELDESLKTWSSRFKNLAE